MSDTATVSKRNYRVSVIFKSLGVEDPIETLVDLVKQAIVKLGGEVTKEEPYERRDFIRVTEKEHVGDFFVSFEVSAPPALNESLQTELRLERKVKRIFVESL